MAPLPLGRALPHCHLRGEHEGRLKAVPPSTNATFILGREPILIVCNRDKHELEPNGKATRRAWRTLLADLRPAQPPPR